MLATATRIWIVKKLEDCEAEWQPVEGEDVYGDHDINAHPCDTLLENLIDQTAVQADVVSSMNHSDAKASNQNFLENAVADFLNKCGKPAPSCGTCESFFPFAKKPTVATGIALYRNMTAAELKKALRDKGLPVSGSKAVLIERLLESETKRLPRRAKGPLAFEWGETIQVQRSEGIPENLS